MKTITKISDIGLGKLNNAEYTNLAIRTSTLIGGTGVEALGIEAADLSRYMELIGTMNELVAQSRISDETADLQAQDKKREDIGVHLLTIVRTERTSPIEERATAAQSLYNLLKPYIGFYRLPNQQETVTINGMLMDLGKEAYAQHVQTLGLTELIEALDFANARYEDLTGQRTTAREVSRIDNSKVVRTEMDALYDHMLTMAFVTSVAAPTEATAQFVTAMNAVIAEVNTAYNQRMAQAKTAVKEKEEKEEKPKAE